MYLLLFLELMLGLRSFIGFIFFILIFCFFDFFESIFLFLDFIINGKLSGKYIISIL